MQRLAISRADNVSFIRPDLRRSNGADFSLVQYKTSGDPLTGVQYYSTESAPRLEVEEEA